MTSCVCCTFIVLLLLVTQTSGHSSGEVWSYEDYRDGTDYTHSGKRVVCTFEEIGGYAIYGHNDVTMTDTSIEACKKACLGGSTYPCYSFDYNTHTHSCFLSSVTKNSPYFGLHDNSIHFEKTCGEVSGAEPESNADGSPPFDVIEGNRFGYDSHCFLEYGPLGDYYQVHKFARVSYSDMYLSFNGKISRIIVTHWTYLQSLQFYYGDTEGIIYNRRTSDMKSDDVMLDEDEYIVSISGQYTQYFSLLKFHTTKRVLGPYGSVDNGYGNFKINGNGRTLAYIAGTKHSWSQFSPVFAFYFNC